MSIARELQTLIDAAQGMIDIVTLRQTASVAGRYTIAEAYGFEDDQLVELQEAVASGKVALVRQTQNERRD